jgi:hypothetical protein
VFLGKKKKFQRLCSPKCTLAVLPFNTVFVGAGVDRTLRDDLKDPSSDRAISWKLALLDIIVDHYNTVLKPEILDNATGDSIPQPLLVRRATSDAFGALNVVQAWFDDDDCIVTDDDTDKIDYPDFQNAWNYDGHECPGGREFSRLIQLIVAHFLKLYVGCMRKWSVAMKIATSEIGF